LATGAAREIAAVMDWPLPHTLGAPDFVAKVVLRW
jgi:hypothetical protein